LHLCIQCRKWHSNKESKNYSNKSCHNKSHTITWFPIGRTAFSKMQMSIELSFWCKLAHLKFLIMTNNINKVGHPWRLDLRVLIPIISKLFWLYGHKTIHKSLSSSLVSRARIPHVKSKDTCYKKTGPVESTKNQLNVLQNGTRKRFQKKRNIHHAETKRLDFRCNIPPPPIEQPYINRKPNLL